MGDLEERRSLALNSMSILSNGSRSHVKFLPKNGRKSSLVQYTEEIDAHETQINKLIKLANKRAKPLNLIDDDRRLHENIKII